MATKLEEVQRLVPEAAPETKEAAASYCFSGRSATGRDISYWVEAPNEDAAASLLRAAQIEVEAIWPRAAFRGKRKKRVSREELGVFAVQLGERIAAGEPMISALRNSARGNANQLLRNGLVEVADLLRETGASSAEAFTSRPDVFPRAFCQIVRLGEVKGDPSGLLKEYGEAQLRTAKTIRGLKGAAIYPAAVVSLAFCVCGVLFYFVLPMMESLYLGLQDVTGGQIPWLTRVLLDFSRFLASWPGLTGLASLVMAIVWAIKWAKGPGRETVQVKALDLPGIGELLRTFHASYTARSIGLLIDSTDLTTTLKETEAASLSPVYREMSEDVCEAVRRHGTTLSDAFAPYAHLMGPEFQSVVLAGEATGRIDVQFIRYANILDDQLRARVETLSRTIEPLLIIGVGLIIGVIVIAAYLPLFTLIGHLSGK